MRKLNKTEKSSLLFTIPANILYSIAALTHAWFQLPPHSYYGLWWVKFCDFLQCQIIPAFFAEEPVWYHLLQSVSLIAWSCLVLSLLVLLTNIGDRFLPKSILQEKRQIHAAGIGLISVFAMSTSLIIFYVKLNESSPHSSPEISWSAMLASISCLFQLTACIILLQSNG